MSIKPTDFEPFLQGYKSKKDSLDSLVVDYHNLALWDENIARDILSRPDEYFEALNMCARALSGNGNVIVRIKNLPEIIPLRKLGSKHLRKLVMVNGIISSIVPKRPRISKAAYECQRPKCRQTSLIPQNESFLYPPRVCPKCGKRSIFRLKEDESIYVDIEEMQIQERPEDLDAGRVPTTINLQVLGDIIGLARAGDIVSLVGVLRPMPISPQSRKKNVNMYIDVNSIEIMSKDIYAVEIDEGEEEQIRRMAMNPNIYELIKNSLFPSIYGYDHIKESVMYLLFGGVVKQKIDITTRGEMNILLVGDPSTAKSQILLVASQLAYRGVYASSRGASAAGLTASVLMRKDGKPVLEIGALVLADKGICCIDEIDKMNPDDRSSIHTAMEQHIVKIDKAGVHAMLPARAAILAAANPTLGRYDRNKTVSENLSTLPIPIISRFDLIFILKDEPDTKEDVALSEHILEMNDKSKESIIARELLRKYIAYARRLNPKMSREAKRYLRDYYNKMRALSKKSDGQTPIAITVRQLESLIRMTEAHARITLKTKTDEKDAIAAIEIMNKSMKDVGMDVESGRIDIDLIMTGVSKTIKDKINYMLEFMSDRQPHSKQEMLKALEKIGVSGADGFKIINKMYSQGLILEPEEGKYRLVR